MSWIERDPPARTGTAGTVPRGWVAAACLTESAFRMKACSRQPPSHWDSAAQRPTAGGAVLVGCLQETSTPHASRAAFAAMLSFFLSAARVTRRPGNPPGTPGIPVGPSSLPTIANTPIPHQVPLKKKTRGSRYTRRRPADHHHHHLCILLQETHACFENGGCDPLFLFHSLHRLALLIRLGPTRLDQPRVALNSLCTMTKPPVGNFYEPAHGLSEWRLRNIAPQPRQARQAHASPK